MSDSETTRYFENNLFNETGEPIRFQTIDCKKIIIIIIKKK